MASGNGANGAQHGVEIDPCAICGKKGFAGRGALCEDHYEAWRLAKESIRFNEAAEQKQDERARVAFEDFVRRMRAETLHAA